MLQSHRTLSQQLCEMPSSPPPSSSSSSSSTLSSSSVAQSSTATQRASPGLPSPTCFRRRPAAAPQADERGLTHIRRPARRNRLRRLLLLRWRQRQAADGQATGRRTGTRARVRTSFFWGGERMYGVERMGVVVLVGGFGGGGGGGSLSGGGAVDCGWLGAISSSEVLPKVPVEDDDGDDEGEDDPKKAAAVAG
ncbi:hypothetical protein DFJ73DRAFT_149061 [Zopfochytrium polystomum]|nr:hypothetical protein DFJ73DRAFT_149061 [Zopfochytrium polystomum]